MGKRGFLFCVIFLLALSARAATLSGHVIEQGEAVADAQVMLTTAENNLLVTKTETNSQGKYRFAVKPGSYNIKTVKTDYASTWAKDIVIGDADVVVNIELTPAVFSDEKQGVVSDECD